MLPDFDRLQATIDTWITDLEQLHRLERFVDDASFRSRWAEARRKNKHRLSDLVRREWGTAFDVDAILDRMPRLLPAVVEENDLIIIVKRLPRLALLLLGVGLAFVIIAGQLPKLFGFSTDATGVGPELKAFVQGLDHTTGPALLVGLGVLAILLVLPRFTTMLPAGTRRR